MANMNFLSHTIHPEPLEGSNSSNVWTFDLNKHYNWKMEAANAATTIAIMNPHAGAAGTICIKNAASVGSLTFALTTINEAGSTDDDLIKTPGGAAISFNTTGQNLHVINYYCFSTSFVLVNYIGNFSTQP